MTIQGRRRPARRGIGLLFTAAILSFAPAEPVLALDAFPGAQGYGRVTQGGRYGRVIWVDNLNNSGPGSLRACVEATGPRNCLFRVSGTITLNESLSVVGPGAAHLSILGQTAPGGGIAITVNPKSSSFRKTPLVVKNTDDVLIRHVRVRPRFSNGVSNVDAITVENSARVYIDHVSASWATDENFNAYSQTSDLTVAYSVFGEGLQPHSKCALLGSDPVGPQNISFWRNLCISNNDRNPDNNHVQGSCIEVIDNVFYNAVYEWAEIFSQLGGTPISFVGNHFKAGPSTSRSTYAINWNSTGSVAPPSIFAQGNSVWAPAKKLITLVAPDTVDKLTAGPSCPVTTKSFGNPVAAYKDVTANAGAFPRDTVDRRFFSEVGAYGVAGTGSIKSVAGAMPFLATGKAYVDRDGDGIADSAESRFGASSGTADMWVDGDGDGWSNFDAFMEWLSRERIAGRYPS